MAQESTEAVVRQETSLQRVEVAARQGASELRRAARVAKQIIGREDLDRFGDSHVLDVLRRVPGLSIGADGVNLRGLGSRYTRILLNGDPAPDGFSLDQLSPVLIERIEIVKAPTAEQSAQGVAGSINIITKNAPRRQQRDLRVTLNDGRKAPDVDVNLNIGESRGPWSFTLPLYASEWERQYSHSHIERQLRGADGQPALAQAHSEFVAWGVMANAAPRLNWELGPDERLSLSGFFQVLDWNARVDADNRVLKGRPALLDDLALSRDAWTRNAQLRWSKGLPKDQSIELRAGLQSASWRLHNRSLDDGQLTLQHQASGGSDGLSQSGKYNRLMGDEHALSLGWELEQREQHEQRRYLDPRGQSLLPDFDARGIRAKLSRQAIYVQDEWDLSRQWQLSLGLRHERMLTSSASALGSALRHRSQVSSPLLHASFKPDAAGQDRVRASLTRTYRAPDLEQLLDRPLISAAYSDPRAGNAPNAPDRLGNPALKPELATGLDLVYERYGRQGSMVSLGVFHRQLRGVVQSQLSLRPVSWASVPRWVSEPVNRSEARSSGLELEAKGRAADLLPAPWADSAQAKALSVRGAFSVYRSQVQGVAGPDNRLDGQAPWSASLGADQRLSNLPLTLGASLNLGPAYTTRLSQAQWLHRSRTRVWEFYGLWAPRAGLSLRATARQGALPWGGPPNQISTQTLADGDSTRTDRRGTPYYTLVLDTRL